MPSILEFAPMGVQVRRGRVKHRGTVDDGWIDKTLLRHGVAAGSHEPGCGAQARGCGGVVGRGHGCVAVEELLLSNPPRRGRTVNNKTQKTAVNPLTRPASRSVMQPSYSVAAR